MCFFLVVFGNFFFFKFLIGQLLCLVRSLFRSCFQRFDYLVVRWKIRLPNLVLIHVFRNFIIFVERWKTRLPYLVLIRAQPFNQFFWFLLYPIRVQLHFICKNFSCHSFNDYILLLLSFFVTWFTACCTF